MKPRFVLIVVGLLTVALASWSASDAQQQGTDQAKGRGPAKQPKSKPILARAVVESSVVVDVRSPVAATIVRIVENRSHVKSGEILVELDSAALQDERQVLRIEIARMKADIARTSASLNAIKAQASLEVVAHELNLEAAKQAIKAFESDDGELAHERKTIESEITLAQAQLKLAKDQLKHRQAIANNGAIPKSELGKTAIEVIKFEGEVASAVRRMKLLNEHQQHRKRTQLRLAEAIAKKDLVGAKHQAALQVNSLESQINGAKAEVDAESARLKRLERQIESSRILAPRDGLVQYASAGSRRTAPRFIEEGANVRERQPLLKIVDDSKLQLRTAVHESQVASIKPGQKVSIQIDAFPDRSFSGSVSDVSQTPLASPLSPGVRNFNVIVKLDDPDQRLKLGLTAVVDFSPKRNKD